MDRFTGGCLCGNVRLVASGRPYRVGICLLSRLSQASWGAVSCVCGVSSGCGDDRREKRATMLGGFSALGVARLFFRGVADEVEVHLGSLDAPDQLRPTYELWTIRRESWLPPFAVTKRYERDRETTGRFEE